MSESFERFWGPGESEGSETQTRDILTVSSPAQQARGSFHSRNHFLGGGSEETGSLTDNTRHSAGEGEYSTFLEMFKDLTQSK